jgi:hypothetical protein
VQARHRARELVRQRAFGVQPSAGTAADSTSFTRRSYSTSTSQVKRRASLAMRSGISGTLLSSTV